MGYSVGRIASFSDACQLLTNRLGFRLPARAWEYLCERLCGQSCCRFATLINANQERTRRIQVPSRPVANVGKVFRPRPMSSAACHKEVATDGVRRTAVAPLGRRCRANTGVRRIRRAPRIGHDRYLTIRSCTPDIKLKTTTCPTVSALTEWHSGILPKLLSPPASFRSDSAPKRLR